MQTRVDSKISYEIITQNPGLLTWNMDSARDVVTDIPEISMVGAMDKSNGESNTEVSLPSEQENVANINLNGGFIEKDIETVPESTYNEVPGTAITKDSQTNLNEKPGFFQQRSNSEDLTSEADNYVDAPATMESETETDDEYRPKNRSDALKNGKHHTYSDADEERMEDPPQFSFYHSNGNTPVSENGRSSFGKRSTSYSYSDTASVSIDDQSDGEKLSRGLPSISSSKSELVDSMSHVTPEASKVSHDFNVQESISSSNVDGQTSLSSNHTCSSPRPVSQNDESCSPTVQSLAPVVVETSPELVRLDLIKGGNDGSKVDPIDSSRSCASFDAKNSNFPSETSSISSTSEGSRCDTTIEKNYVVDYSSNLLNSSTSPEVFVGSQTGKQLPSADNDIEINSTVACSKVLANSGIDSEGRDGSSLTGMLLPCSAEMGMEVSPDMPYKVCGPSTVDEIHLKDSLDDVTDCVTVSNVVADVDSHNSVVDVGSQSSVADVDSQSSVAEISDENLSAFCNTADVSVSESHEDALENGMPMPAEVDSKLTSDFNSGGEKLVGDASPTCSKSDEDISDEGFHDLSALDNATTDIVPNVELDVSDNDSDTSSGGVNHAVSLSSTSLNGSLPWISTNTYQSSSKAGEICHDTVVESDGTLPADDNSESEIRMQKSPLEVSSEGLSTALDNNDLESCESLSPKPSQYQRERDTETKSPGESILVDKCIDSSLVNNLNLLESEAIEQRVKEQTPCASHAVADEEFLQSNVFGGLKFVPQSAGLEFAPQSAGLELNRPSKELNLDPTFPSCGLIPETTPPNQEDMPPLPPLPPMQWRIGKVPHSFPTFMEESVETSTSVPSAAPLSGSRLNVPIGSKPSEMSVFLGSDELEQLSGGFVNNASEKQLESSIQFPTIGSDLYSQYDSSELPTMPNHGCIEDFGSKVNNLSADHAAQNHKLVDSQEASLQLPQDLSAKYEDFKDDTDVHVSQSSSDDHNCPETKALTPTQSTKVEDKGHWVPDASNAETAEPSNTSVQKIISGSLGDAMWPVNAFSVAPTLDTDKPEVVPMVRLPRPRSPLVDAVAAHDRRTVTITSCLQYHAYAKILTLIACSDDLADEESF